MQISETGLSAAALSHKALEAIKEELAMYGYKPSALSEMTLWEAIWDQVDKTRLKRLP